MEKERGIVGYLHESRRRGWAHGIGVGVKP